VAADDEHEATDDDRSVEGSCEGERGRIGRRGVWTVEAVPSESFYHTKGTERLVRFLAPVFEKGRGRKRTG
jgi:hypothetical protein